MCDTCVDREMHTFSSVEAFVGTLKGRGVTRAEAEDELDVRMNEFSAASAMYLELTSAPPEADQEVDAIIDQTYAMFDLLWGEEL